MKIPMIRPSSVAVALLALCTLSPHSASGFVIKENQKSPQEHVSGLLARITLPNGVTETVRLDGIGCTESMCSRVLIKGKTTENALVEIWFDSIVAIRDIRDNGALFLLNDNSERRLSFIRDFSVLYLAKDGASKDKLDLTKIKSLEILAPRR